MNQGGFIYAIGAEGVSHVKIGSTRSAIEKRLKQLQTGHPLRLYLIASVPVEQALFPIEKQVHKLLSDYKYEGEWFTISLDSLLFEHLVQQAISLVVPTTKHNTIANAHRDTNITYPILSFGQRVAKLRTKYQWTIERLAERSGVPISLLEEIETGIETYLTLETALSITKALRSTMDYMTGLITEMGNGTYWHTWGECPDKEEARIEGVK